MTAQLSVPVAELREVCLRLLDHLASTEGSTIELDWDYFWSVSPEELYNVYDAPRDLTIGQLSESWDNLAAAPSGEARQPIAYELVWLADILRAIGQRVVS